MGWVIHVSKTQLRGEAVVGWYSAIFDQLPFSRCRQLVFQVLLHRLEREEGVTTSSRQEGLMAGNKIGCGRPSVRSAE